MLQAFPTIQRKVQKLLTSLADLVLCWLNSCDFFSRSSDLLRSSEAFSLMTEFRSAMIDSLLRSATSCSNTWNKNKFQVVYCLRSTHNYKDILYFRTVNTVSWHMSKCNFIYTHTKMYILPCAHFHKIHNCSKHYV